MPCPVLVHHRHIGKAVQAGPWQVRAPGRQLPGRTGNRGEDTVHGDGNAVFPYPAAKDGVEMGGIGQARQIKGCGATGTAAVARKV